jgi:hypothetical protein
VVVVVDLSASFAFKAVQGNVGRGLWWVRVNRWTGVETEVSSGWKGGGGVGGSGGGGGPLEL